MKFSDFNFKLNTDYNIAKIGDKEIQVLKYLPIRDKIDLIEIALQKAEENGIYNDMKLDIYFSLYLIYMYTDLEFTDEERADAEGTYDILNCNNVIISVIGAMEDDEYDNLINYLKEVRKEKDSYKKSTVALLETAIRDLPKNAEAAANIVDNFDKEKYQEVISFANSANGGRPLDFNRNGQK